MNIMKFATRLAALAGLALLPNPAAAYDWMMQGHVTFVEPTYVPDRVVFSLDVGAAGCAAGAMLKWNATGGTEAAKIANVQGILSTLLTARVTGKEIRVYGNAANCTIDYIHFL